MTVSHISLFTLKFSNELQSSRCLVYPLKYQLSPLKPSTPNLYSRFAPFIDMPLLQSSLVYEMVRLSYSTETNK